MWGSTDWIQCLLLKSAYWWVVTSGLILLVFRRSGVKEQMCVSPSAAPTAGAFPKSSPWPSRNCWPCPQSGCVTPAGQRSEGSDWSSSRPRSWQSSCSRRRGRRGTSLAQNNSCGNIQKTKTKCRVLKWRQRWRSGCGVAVLTCGAPPPAPWRGEGRAWGRWWWTWLEGSGGSVPAGNAAGPAGSWGGWWGAAGWGLKEVAEALITVFSLAAVSVNQNVRCSWWLVPTQHTLKLPAKAACFLMSWQSIPQLSIFCKVEQAKGGAQDGVFPFLGS